jgi:DNA adenine methylase
MAVIGQTPHDAGEKAGQQPVASAVAKKRSTVPAAHNFHSPLRYPGGKGKVANFIKLLMLENDLVGHAYVEPYAGGASVALSLLYEEFASEVHINDLNRSVFAFWNAVLNDTDRLCARIVAVAVTMDEWGRQRDVQLSEQPDPLDLAFSTFFLNRTNRSGIIEGGVIGGKNQTGAWKLDARFNKDDLIRRIKKIARYGSRITLTQHDAAHYLGHVLPTFPEATFVYLDPPYYVKGEGLYEHFYHHADHAQIAGLVRDLTHPWVVSYDAAPKVIELYEGFDRITYNLSYSAQDRYRGAEVMFFSPGLQRPDVASPAKIHSKAVAAAQRERMQVMG